MPVSTTEADIIFNKANVALAKSRRLIASWLPPRTAEEMANAKSEEELEKEELEIFTPVPEKLGLGASLPKEGADGSANRQSLGSNDKLRKHLLGKDFQKLGMNSAVPPKLAQSKPMPSQPNLLRQRTGGDDDDEAKGRSSLGKSKRKRPLNGGGGQNVEDSRELEQPDSSTLEDGPPATKSSSYLDEVLSERSRRRKKKTKRKVTNEASNGE